jgi:sugar O-acyltransferase (sialic acid O-acetyltransferase NeuD family)
VSRLIVVGAGGHGAVVAEAAAESGRWDEIVFLDDDESLDHVLEYPVVGTTERISTLASDDPEFVVTIGNNRTRLELSDKIARSGLRLVSVIHPAACISKSASIAAGTVVCAGAIVNARAKIGRACIINTGATIDHDCVLEDGVHVSPGANLAGIVRVGECAWIGIGSSVKEEISIGHDSVVGAGSAVVNDIGDSVTVGGVPARLLTKP